MTTEVTGLKDNSTDDRDDRASGPKRRSTAEAMATKQRDISVSEFFTKNRHLLGFDNPQKALLTTIKEAVDNALDACEEAGILPTLTVIIEEQAEGRFRVTVEDNGPGIVKAQIPKIFAKLLYGSKFHRLKQSRGQQGIGISAAGMYGQLTTGRPIVVTSKIGKGKPAHKLAVRIDARTNAPEVLEDQVVVWEQDHGTRVSIELAGLYRGGRASVAAYLEQTVVANPHLELTFVPPKGEKTHWPRATEQLPTETVEIKPHPYGVELGMLLKAFQEAGDRSAKAVLMEDFSRVTEPVAIELLKKSGIDPAARASKLDGAKIESVHRVIQISQASVLPANKLLKQLLKREDKFQTAILELGKNFNATLLEGLCKRAGIDPVGPAKKVELTQLERFITALEGQQVRILPPPATCVAPIGEALIVEGLKRRFKGEFFTSHTRQPAVYRGNPFVVEVGIAYGGELPKDESAEVLRFANRVPLLYQPRACATTEAVVNVSWKSYAKDGGINQRGAEFPVGPLAVFVHLASVWVPFTNEAKEAIASYDEIIEEIRAALMECGRKLATYLNAQGAEKSERERKSLFEKYIEEVAAAIGEITKLGTPKVRTDFLSAMSHFVQLDELKPKSEPPTGAPPSSSAEVSGEAMDADVPATKSKSPVKTAEKASTKAAAVVPKPAEVASVVKKNAERDSAPEPSKTTATTAKPAAPVVVATPAAPTNAKPASTVKSATTKPSSGEWPARPSMTATPTAAARPTTPTAPTATSATGGTWLERELAARIAAKKSGTPVAVAQTKPSAKAPPTKTSSTVAETKKPAVSQVKPSAKATPVAISRASNTSTGKLGASKKTAQKAKLSPKTKTSAKPTPSGKKGSTKGALAKRKGRR